MEACHTNTAVSVLLQVLRLHGDNAAYARRCQVSQLHNAWAQVWSVAWQTDGSRLASASDDKSVALYNLS